MFLGFVTWQRCIHPAPVPEVIRHLLSSNCLPRNSSNLSGTATFIAPAPPSHCPYITGFIFSLPMPTLAGKQASCGHCLSKAYPYLDIFHVIDMMMLYSLNHKCSLRLKYRNQQERNAWKMQKHGYVFLGEGKYRFQSSSPCPECVGKLH